MTELHQLVQFGPTLCVRQRGRWGMNDWFGDGSGWLAGWGASCVLAELLACCCMVVVAGCVLAGWLCSGWLAVFWFVGSVRVLALAVF